MYLLLKKIAINFLYKKKTFFPILQVINLIILYLHKNIRNLRKTLFVSQTENVRLHIYNYITTKTRHIAM